MRDRKHAANSGDTAQGGDMDSQQRQKQKQQPRKPLLIAYNAVQTCGWLYAAVLLALHFVAHGTMRSTHEVVGSVIIFLQTLAWVEIPLALFGVMPAAVSAVVLQLIGRNVVVLLTVQHTPDVQGLICVDIMYISWVLAEIVRFPWLLGKSVGMVPPWLNYLRYTAFTVLYPTGGGAEMWTMLVARDIAGTRTVPLVQWTFDMQGLIYYVYAPLIVPGFLYVYLHMWKQRRAKL